MSERNRSIEILRQQLKEAERESMQSDRIIKFLVEECEMKGNPTAEIQDENSTKDEILAAWLTGYEMEVKNLCETGDGTGRWPEVVGDVMDEMRQRVAKTRTQTGEGGSDQSEIDFRSILDVLDDDAASLGRLCGELLVKFFPRRIAVEKEKTRRQLQEAKEERGDRLQIDTDDAKVDKGESRVVGSQGGDGQVEEDKPVVEQANAELFGVETQIDTVEIEGEKKEIEQEEDAADVVLSENYVEFTIVDENDQPLGVPVEPDAPTAAVEAEATEQVALAESSKATDEKGSCETLDTRCSFDAGAETGGEVQEASESQMWLNVVTQMIDFSSDGDGAFPDVYEIVNMFVPGENPGSGDLDE